MIRTLAILSLFALTACGAVQPAGPGHEPPSGGNVNPVTGEHSTGH